MRAIDSNIGISSIHPNTTLVSCIYRPNSIWPLVEHLDLIESSSLGISVYIVTFQVRVDASTVRADSGKAPWTKPGCFSATTAWDSHVSFTPKCVHVSEGKASGTKCSPFSTMSVFYRKHFFGITCHYLVNQGAAGWILGTHFLVHTAFLRSATR